MPPFKHLSQAISPLMIMWRTWSLTKTKFTTLMLKQESRLTIIPSWTCLMSTRSQFLSYQINLTKWSSHRLVLTRISTSKTLKLPLKTLKKILKELAVKRTSQKHNLDQLETCLRKMWQVFASGWRMNSVNTLEKFKFQRDLKMHQQ